MTSLRLVFFVIGLALGLSVTSLPAAAVSPWQAHELAKAATDQAWSQVEQMGIQLLEQPQSPTVEAQLRYNLGLSLYHQDRFEEALPQFEELSQADIDRELKARSNYNLGNTHFRLEQFDQAMSAYQQALLLNPDDDDARYNIEVLLRRQENPENQDQNQDSGESEDDEQQDDNENESEESDESEQEQEDSGESDEGDSEEQQGDPSEGGEKPEEQSSQNQDAQLSEEERKAVEEELERARLLEYFRQQERDGRPPMVAAPQPLPPGGKAW